MLSDLAPSDLEGRVAQTTPNLHLKSGFEAEQILLENGFINKGISKGGYTTFKHSDGSVITFKPNGEVVRTPQANSGWRVDISDRILKRPHTFPDEQEVIQ
jgi:predicted RNA binding protein YcfA (HicA-like mRNA interferase family)